MLTEVIPGNVRWRIRDAVKLIPEQSPPLRRGPNNTSSDGKNRSHFSGLRLSRPRLRLDAHLSRRESAAGGKGTTALNQNGLMNRLLIFLRQGDIVWMTYDEYRNNSGLFVGRNPIRGSGDEKNPAGRVGSRQEGVRNITGRFGSGREILKYHGSGRVILTRFGRTRFSPFEGQQCRRGRGGRGHTKKTNV